MKCKECGEELNHMEGNYYFAHNHGSDQNNLSPEEIQSLVQAKAEGRLVVLPCKVGATVYTTQYMCDYKHCDTHTRMSCCGCLDYAKNKYVIQSRQFSLLDLKDIGKTVFLTREEAEKALQEGLEWARQK